MQIENIFDGVKWVWLDLDDTLIDFRTNSRLTLAIVYDKYNLSQFFPTMEEWRDCYEAHNHDLWARYSRGEITQQFLRIDRFATPLRPHWHDTEDRLIEFATTLDPQYLEILAEQKALIPGAIDLLDTLRTNGFNIGILSNGFTDVQQRKLHVTGIDRKIDLLVLSDHIGINKPDTRLYRHAMERAGDLDSRHHLIIGDNISTDIAGGLAADWRAAYFNPSLNSAPDPSQPYVTISQLNQLTDHLRRLRE